MKPLFMFTLAAMAMGLVTAAPAAAQTRKSITQLTATELASLRKGIAQMIAWNNAPANSANFRRSLRYWANMHGFIGFTAEGPVCQSRYQPSVAINFPGMSGLTIQSENTPDQSQLWCTCQHGTDQFLTWHRMYLYYFEQVLQQAAGDPKLRLPFWDYETDGHMPPAFRAPTYVDGNGTTQPNPLYVANRQAQLNAGTAALDSDVTSTAGAMPSTSYSRFNSTLQNTPHGAVHCATGVDSCPSGYMGFVPAAGNDPIFYMHHANIDRLYECWMGGNLNRLPPANLRGAQFSFIDGNGNVVTRKVADMMTTQQLGYGYAAGGGCPATLKLATPKNVWQATPLRVFPLATGVTLRSEGTAIPLSLPGPAKAQLLAAVPKNKQPVRAAAVVLSNLALTEIPRVLYKVSLQGPDGAKVPVGVINFFNETAGHDHGDHGGSSDQRFDATAALQQIGAPEGATLLIEPTTGLTGTAVPAEALAAANGKVTVGAVALEIR